MYTNEFIASRASSARGSSFAMEKQYFFIMKSNCIIYEIDTVFAKHDGFTDEELDFIIHYDSKYRMGKELSEPGLSQDEEE